MDDRVDDGADDGVGNDPRSAAAPKFPAFDATVAEGGYRWWYVDAISDDGQHAVTLILFVGSVFSPYYAWARRRGPALAEQHCALNVALYGAPWRWCMTERGLSAQQRDHERFRIGPSEVTRDDQQLVFDIDERSMPLPRRVRGTVRVALPTPASGPFTLDADGDHEWQPLAPHTRISVDMTSPRLQWQGNAYVDSNSGRAPLESAFRFWQWTRAHLPNGDTAVLYDIQDTLGATTHRSLRLGPDGRQRECPEAAGLAQSHDVCLPSTRWWRMPRSLRIDPGSTLESLVTLEDAPFYSRSRLHTSIFGEPAECMHESLDLKRFDHPVTRCLLPFRMPRRSHWPHWRHLADGSA